MNDRMTETLALLARASTATLSMQLLKRGLRTIWMRGPMPLRPAAHRFVAPAYTLRFIPMREDLGGHEMLADPAYPPRRAIEDCPPGHALVIDCRGVPDAAMAGDILITRLKARGVAALVGDGPVRDAEAVAGLGFPVFCAGACAPAGLSRHFGADIGRPIACGGVAVFPGDILAGDGDGVVVIPRALAAEVAAAAVEQEEMEAFLQRRIADGAPVPGTYPPNAETRAAYEAWRLARREPPLTP